MTKFTLSLATLALSLAAGAPALAATPAMTKAEMALMAKCAKLTPAAAAKNAQCVALKKAHMDSMQAGDAMMSQGDAMAPGK